MCSWCWGFRPTWDNIQYGLPQGVQVEYVLGGLAPDTQESMPESVQLFLQNTWEKIQENIPGTEFNFDYWRVAKPRRSTYPACRAVLAAKQQGLDNEQAMIDAIQRAYYLHAQSPSDDDTLISLAEQLSLNVMQFTQQLNSPEINTLLRDDIDKAQELLALTGNSGFPSLAMKVDDKYYSVPMDYRHPEVTLYFLEKQDSH